MEELLKKARLSNKLKQKEIADALGCSVSTISLYETGKRTPSLERLNKICDICNINQQDKEDIKSKLFGNERNFLYTIKSILSESVETLRKIAENKELTPEEERSLLTTIRDLSRAEEALGKTYYRFL